MPSEFGNMTSQLSDKITGVTDEEMRAAIKLVCRRAKLTDDPDEFTRTELSKLGLWEFAERVLQQHRKEVA